MFVGGASRFDIVQGDLGEFSLSAKISRLREQNRLLKIRHLNDCIIDYFLFLIGSVIEFVSL